MPLYTFSCFRVPDTVCDKLDAIIRAFWWAYDLGTRKLHFINWNEVCTPKSEGGLGLKRFELMNQAMLAKQFWRIAHNPQSLLARTLKVKYFPKGFTHDCSPKPHNSWIWRNIIKSETRVNGGLGGVHIFPLLTKIGSLNSPTFGIITFLGLLLGQ